MHTTFVIEGIADQGGRLRLERRPVVTVKVTSLYS